MTDEEIENVVLQILIKTFGASHLDSIKANVDLIRLELDSLGFIGIILELEQKFSVTLMNKEFVYDNFQNLSSICATVRQQLLSKMTQ